MRRKMTMVLGVLLAVAISAQAAVNIAVNNYDDFVSTTSWTATDLFNAPPTVTGDGAPVAAGFLEAAGQMAADAQIDFTFKAASDYNNLLATNALVAGTFGTYISELTVTGNTIEGINKSWGIGSGANGTDSDGGRISNNEAFIIEISITNTTFDIILQDFSWINESAGDRCDIYIYDASSSNATLVLSNQRPGNYSGDYSLSDGDIIVIGCRAETYRLQSITFDIASTATDVISPLGFTAIAANRQVQLDWVADSAPNLASYNVYRSREQGTNYQPLVGAQNLTTNTYTDPAVTNRGTYYYVATAVNTALDETGFSVEVSATPFVEVPVNLAVANGDGEIAVSWDVSTDLYLGSYNVYRRLGSSTNGYSQTNNVGTNTVFVDTAVLNETQYNYAVSMVSGLGTDDESDLSAETIGVPTDDFVLIELDNNLQGDLRVDYIFGEGTNTFPDVDIAVRHVNGQSRAGIYGFVDFPEMARSVIGFPLSQADITNKGKTTNDILKVTFRYWMHANSLLDSGPHSAVEIYHSRTRNSTADIADWDWSNISNQWDFVSTVPGLNSDSEEGWFELDVTDQVMADLTLDNQTNGTAGVSFQMRANDDMLFTTNMYAQSYVTNAILVTNETTLIVTTNGFATSTNYNRTTGAKLMDNDAGDDGGTGSPLGVAFVPQLRITWAAVGATDFELWAAGWGSADVTVGTEDYDGDGANNLLEYGLDGNPTNPLVQGATLPTLTAKGGGLEYVHPVRSDDDSILYTVETRTNLVTGSWTTVGVPSPGGTLVDVTNTIDTVEDTKFIRLTVEQN